MHGNGSCALHAYQQYMSETQAVCTLNNVLTCACRNSTTPCRIRGTHPCSISFQIVASVTAVLGN